MVDLNTAIIIVLSISIVLLVIIFYYRVRYQKRISIEESKQKSYKKARPPAPQEQKKEPFLPDMLSDEEEIAPMSRYIQGQVYRVISKSEQERCKTSFMAGSQYLLNIRIGPEDRDWLKPSKDYISPEITFPENELPWEKDNEELQVVFNEPNHSSEPQVGTLILPRNGPSSTCQFQFNVLKKFDTFTGRIVVLHKNRVIQTAILKGQVLSDKNQKSNRPIELYIESVIRKDLSDLNARQKFDVALIANHTEDDQSTLTGIADKRVMFNSLKNAEATINRINKTLEEIIANPGIYPKDIFNKKNISWIRELSLHGRDLYDGIFIDEIVKEKLENATRIQLLSKREDYLPLEFLYDGPAPAMDAPLCPETKTALEKGKCIKCKMKNEPPAEYVCPLGFWFLKMIIERHLILDPDFQEINNEFCLDFEPIGNRNTLQILRSALCATSSKVDEIVPDNSQKLFSILQDATNKKTIFANTWVEWESAIKTNDPSLLVLLTHTFKGGSYNQDQMEIGGTSTLYRIHINKQKHVRGSESNRPVLLLLGCDTGVSYSPLNGSEGTEVNVPFQTFAAKFVREGAVIVVSTQTKISAQHAELVAETIITELKQSAEEGKSLGDTLLHTRKKYFLEGIPMVLTLIANGDADWRFSLS
jgi:hypothetical protein